MRCPTCDETLRGETFYGQAVDRCAVCDGIWLDESELGAVVRRFGPVPAPGAESKPCAEGPACPKCGTAMDAVNYAYDSGVLINRCASCAGVWLQSGQLEQIARYRTGTPATRALADAMADEIRKSNRWRSVQRVLRSRVLSGSVAATELFAALLMAGNLKPLYSMVRFLWLPIMCIWFPEFMGSIRNISLGLGRPMITHSSPGNFVVLGGWLLLLAPVLAFLATWLSQ